MIPDRAVRRVLARVLWGGLVVVAAWGLLIASGKGYSTFKTRLAVSPAGAQQAVDQWNCVADVVERLTRPGEALVLRTPDTHTDRDHYIAQRVIESVYPRIDLVVAGGAGTVVVTYAAEGAPGERCGEVAVRVDR